MKRKVIQISAIVLIIILCASVFFAVRLGSGTEETPRSNVNFTGVWIATVYNINYPTMPDLSEEELKAELDEIVALCLETGIDTVFFQARGSGDGVMYKSEIFEVAPALSSTEADFDPLGYLVSTAHEKGLKVHAWVNPLRASLTEEGDIPRSDLAVSYGGMRYYDCGLPEVRDFICDGISEILNSYKVDGIIFDDYFYPYPDAFGTAFPDRATFEKYGDGFEDIGDFRRDSVNKLVESVYTCIKGKDPSLLFGVSPFGIWKNGNGGEDGSPTTGMESYSTLYCDTLAFVRSGHVDYIAPQLYWDSNFDVLYDWWQEMLEDTGVTLTVSLAASRYENDWENPSGTITSQECYAQCGENYGGCVYYGYSAIKNNIEGLKDEITKIHAGAK